jgi:hypothetical protein
MVARSAEISALLSDLLSLWWVLLRDQVGRTPCIVYVSDLLSLSG